MLVRILRGGMLAVAAFLGVCVYAQTPPVTQAPPPITFSDWTLVGAAGESTEYLLKFPSALPSGTIENDTVPLHVYIPKSAEPVPAVVILHYWGATDLRLERSLSLELAKSGIASAVIELPYHLHRTPPGYRSGALAIQADPDELVRTMTQSVSDVRRAVDFLCTRPEINPNKLGVAGTSLGALVAVLSYGVEHRFTTGAFLLGGVDLAHIIWTSSRVVREREVLRANGYDEQLLHSHLLPIEPAQYLTGRTGDTLVIGAKFDTVVPPDSTKALLAALPGSKTVWLDTGHYGGMFVQRRLLEEVSTFLRKSFGHETYTAPKSLHAPTTRIGAEFSTGSGFDIEFGIDLIRPRDTHSPFATFLLAPRGARLFLGTGIDHGVAAGIFVKSGQSGVGLLWSIVL